MKSLLHKIVSVPFLSALFLSLGVSQMLVLPLLADEPTNISDIKGCRAIKGEAERLLCYDTVSDGGIFNEQQLKQVQVEKFGSDTMPKAQESAPNPAPTASPGSEKGTAQGVAPAPQPAPATGTDISADKLSVTIVRTKKGDYGIYYFQTADGQVWKQVNAVAWNIKAPFDAEIKAGVLDSFFLVHEGGKSTRVKRVK